MIYFIQDNERFHIKIGYTSDDNPEARKRALQTGSSSGLTVLATMPGSMEDEKALHRRFAKWRVVGEWFSPHPEILKLISQNQHQQQVDFRSIWPLKIYLAGKINTQFDWRMDILRSNYNKLGNGSPDEPWPVLGNVIYDDHHYTGPFYFPCNHIGRGDHATGVLKHAGDSRARRPKIAKRCLEAIERSDVLFAWIDSPDCYGTLVEIGYARGLGKMIWIAFDVHMDDFWFATEMDKGSAWYLKHESANHALCYTLNHYSYLHDDWLKRGGK